MTPKKLYALAALALALAAGHPPARGQTKAPEAVPEASVDPDADAAVRRMSDYLAKLQTFGFHADGTIDVVLRSGQKLEMGYASDLVVRRPDGIRSDRRGDLADLQFFYDGKRFALYGRRANYYATATAPPTIDQAIDAARDRLGLEAPAADLLYGKPYEGLMANVVSGVEVGPAMVDDVRCNHLAFRADEVDWQIWIEDGPRPLPRKYVVTSKEVQGSPESSVLLSGWNLSPEIDDATFRFDPPEGAQQIEFRRGTKNGGSQ